MKLADKQLLEIEKYLDLKELTHLDLRYEVLDHMINGIEKSMSEESLSFEDSFDLEIKKWNPELTSFSSLWLGWAYSGPRIMIQKCARITRKAYLKSSLFAILLSIILYFFSTILSPEPYETFIKNMLGISYLAILSAMVFFHFKIRHSVNKTSYSYLFRIHAIGFGFVFLILNPLWMNLLNFRKEPKIIFASLFMHLFIIAFSGIFWDLYKSHKNTKKYRLA